MPKPTPYTRSYSFTDYQASNPTTPLPGNSVDSQLNAIQQTFTQILANLVLIQRDDGYLANGSVGLDQLAASVIVGVRTISNWVTGHAYAKDDFVWQIGVGYRCAIAHTSGTFATDLAAVKWVLVFDLAATVTANIATQIAVIASTAAVSPAVTPLTSTSNATAINLATSRVFKHTFSENTTFSFTNPDATGTRCAFELYLTNVGGAYTPTWPASVKWTNGVVPSFNTASEHNDVYFRTIDGGTTWVGSVIAEAWA